MKDSQPYLKIQNRIINKDSPTFIVAEMSANHNGDINNAFKINIEMPIVK